MSTPDARTACDGGPSFSVGHRLYRAAWALAWGLLAAWTPPPMHRWRIFLLNLFGAKAHPSCHIYPSTRVWHPKLLHMEARSTLGPRVNCYCMAQITLKARAIVSQDATLCAGTHDVADPYFPLQARPITIGQGAWVAAEAFVGPGVSVGEGAVLGARAVAFKDLEPWTIYVGNPCVALKPRIIRP